VRLRRHYKNYNRSGTGENGEGDLQISEDELGIGEKNTQQQKTYEITEDREVKEAKPTKPFKKIRQLLKNPNLNMQIMMILLSLNSDNIAMDRRIDGMTMAIDKVRNITELVNSGMQSMKVASEVPKSIRRLLE